MKTLKKHLALVVPSISAKQRALIQRFEGAD